MRGLFNCMQHKHEIWVKGTSAVVPSSLLDTSDFIKVPKSTCPQTHLPDRGLVGLIIHRNINADGDRLYKKKSVGMR